MRRVIQRLYGWYWPGTTGTSVSFDACVRHDRQLFARLLREKRNHSNGKLAQRQEKKTAMLEDGEKGAE